MISSSNCRGATERARSLPFLLRSTAGDMSFSEVGGVGEDRSLGVVMEWGNGGEVGEDWSLDAWSSSDSSITARLRLLSRAVGGGEGDEVVSGATEEPVREGREPLKRSSGSIWGSGDESRMAGLPREERPLSWILRPLFSDV